MRKNPIVGERKLLVAMGGLEPPTPARPTKYKKIKQADRRVGTWCRHLATTHDNSSKKHVFNIYFI
ncbi:MAG: hypothetical protein IIA06_12600 [Proteobacteria bacterium]|nr:hypothetical protein [Pseudomonadota bacterium]